MYFNEYGWKFQIENNITVIINRKKNVLYCKN